MPIEDVIKPLRLAQIIVALVGAIIIVPIIAYFGMKSALSEQINDLNLQVVEKYAKKHDIDHMFNRIDKKLDYLTKQVSEIKGRLKPL